MTALYLLEPDDPGPSWAPFAGARPIAELRAGLWTVREAWERWAGVPAKGIIGSHVDGFHEQGVPPVIDSGHVRGPAVIGATWFVPSGTAPTFAPETRRLVAGSETVGWVVPEGASGPLPNTAGPGAPIEGLALAGTYSLLDALDQLLGAQCLVRAETGALVPEASVVLGDPSLVFTRGAKVEPGVVFDVSRGAVVLDRAEVRHGSRLEGPLYVGPGSIVWGGLVRHSVIGPACRVRGEVTHSIFLGYGNKAHDGFVGHSIIGRWANLGALTTTSNLKNTYGEVRLSVAGQQFPTGRQFVGSLIGDHVKTAIGTMLGTGTVISVGANVFGAAPVPKFVPPFAWGTDERAVMDEAGFLKIVSRVMPRRGVEFTAADQASLRTIYARCLGR